MNPRTFFAALAAAACASADESIVKLQYGTIQGLVNPFAREFRGIPYATPPTGELRWETTVPYTGNWTGIKQTTEDSAACWQHCFQPPHVCPTVLSEDCLYLNVFTPRASQLTEPLPVLIFMHGGDFKDGYGGGPLYNGTEMVKNANVVFVAMNYRLGAMGFLYTGNDSTSDPWVVEGNFGIQDQRQAFRWVIENIAAFGGDPNRITISGQSAGAMSVATHLLSPLSQGLYHAAILYSDPFAIPWRNAQRGMDFAGSFAKKANCSDSLHFPPAPFKTVSQCLRSLTAEQVIAAQVATQADLLAELDKILELFLPWSPIYGTPEVPYWPLDAFRSGNIADVPLILSTTNNETVVFVYAAEKKNMTNLAFDVIVGLVYGLKKVGTILDRYSPSGPAPSDLRPYAADIATDSLFKCANRNATLTLIGGQRKSPVYLYRFGHQMSFSDIMWGANFTECAYPNTVCHGGDLAAIYHPDQPGLTSYTPDEDALSFDIQTYVGNFAATGNPNSNLQPGQVHWNPLDSSESMMLMNTPQRQMSQFYDTGVCDLWDQLGYDFY